MRRNPSSGDNASAKNDDGVDDHQNDGTSRKRPAAVMRLRRRDSSGRAETFQRAARNKKKNRRDAVVVMVDEEDADLFDDQGNVIVIGPKNPPPKDKQEEEEEDDSVHMFDDDNEDDNFSSVSSDVDGVEDDDAHDLAPPPFKTRAIPMERAEMAVRINLNIVSGLCVVNEHLLSNPNYLRQNTAGEIVHQNLERISTLLRAVDEWGPITVPGDQPRVIPPQIPQADGTEVRFTNVAASLGIPWSAVPVQDKMAVYERAAQLHVQHYGVRPSKARMWTSEGYRPIAYYNERTYERTMKRALEEYKAGAGKK